MELANFQVSGKIKKINKKKVRQGQNIKEPCCYIDWPPPYLPGTDYWEVILEEGQISLGFGNETPEKNVRLVFFGKKISGDFEKKFAVGEKYLFYCTGGGVDYYFPHNWEKLTNI